ncbi:MAG: hypothetical protein LBT32_03475 [Peptococcaceae bacterium]|jgi:hypothetical protein|nr:hypothetical protein [Peptococcaceae bacterium]
MHRKHWLITMGALCAGFLIGVSSLAVASSSMRADVLAKLGWNEHISQIPLHQGASGHSDGSVEVSAGVTAEVEPNEELLLAHLEQEIIADYKRDVGMFFEAWKSAVVTDRRKKVTQAYIGPLLEKHFRQIEEYVSAGLGMEVSQIDFTKINVEKADAVTATLLAEYSYVGQDVSLGEDVWVGEKYEQFVKLRVNMIHVEDRWLISGETLVVD